MSIGSAPRTASTKARALAQEGSPLFWILLGSTAFLLGVGLLMVLSASAVYSIKDNGSAWGLAFRQFIFAGVGLALMYVAMRLPRITWVRLATPFLWFVFALLIAVLIVGTEVGGQKNWIVIYGPIRLQPSEFAKLALVMWVPFMLATREAKARRWPQLLTPISIGGFATIGLVLAERDGGTPMVMAPILLAMLWVAGVPKRFVATVTALGFTGVALLTYLEDYRRARFESWLNPWADPKGDGMQAVHAQLALGSGGIWGEGLGAGREKWGSLPAAHTDFILAVVGEELGLLGTLAILFAVSALVWACLQISLKTADPFVRYASVGVAAWIGVQATFNIGAVIGAIPITGVTLPLVSYGGSSLIPTLVALGMVMSFVRPPSLAWTMPGRRK